MPPVLPLTFAALVPSASEDICTILKKFFLFIILEFRMALYTYGALGDITEDYGTELCLALKNCSKIGDSSDPIYLDDPIYGQDPAAQ